MKFLKLSVLAFSLLASSGYADGFGFNIGPFNMQFFTSDGVYYENNRVVLDHPICRAISNQNRLEIIVQGAENVSTKEKKIITKKLIVEPYAFGVTREGKPVLRGNVIDEKLVEEVNLKYGDDRFDEKSVSSSKNGKGFFSGLFSSDENKTIDIQKVDAIHVIEGSHFDAPKDYKGFNDASIQVVCQVPSTR